MPEKIQHTAASLQEKMLTRYNDGLHHKHNKHHMEYRKHYRSHPSNTNNHLDEETPEGPTGMLRELKLKRIRKRPDKGQFH